MKTYVLASKKLDRWLGMDLSVAMNASGYPISIESSKSTSELSICSVCFLQVYSEGYSKRFCSEVFYIVPLPHLPHLTICTVYDCLF